MEFLKYQHIERLGNDGVEGILNGECHIFHKLDGTNASIWIKDNEIHCGSRRRELSLSGDNAGFMEYALSEPKFLAYLQKYPENRLIGEFLVKHTIKDYISSAWRKLYVFDVMQGEEYLKYDDFIKGLEEFEIDYIPRIAILNSPTEEQLNEIKTDFLMKEGIGEGIVIKNYDFINKFGNKIFAKIIHNEFNNRWKTVRVSKFVGDGRLEDIIVECVLTAKFIDKEVAKRNITNPLQLVGTIYHEFIKEEIWDILKKFKAPTIDFRYLKKSAEHKIRTYISDYHV